MECARNARKVLSVLEIERHVKSVLLVNITIEPARNPASGVLLEPSIPIPVLLVQVNAVLVQKEHSVQVGLVGALVVDEALIKTKKNRTSARTVLKAPSTTLRGQIASANAFCVRKVREVERVKRHAATANLALSRTHWDPARAKTVRKGHSTMPLGLRP